MRHFTSQDVATLFPEATDRSYQAGQIVVYEGDKPAFMYFVKKGALKNYDIDENGVEKILHVVGELGFFSIIYAYGGNTEVDGFYSTLDNTDLLLVPIEDFRNRLSSDVEFANKVFEWFVAEMGFIMGRLKGLEKTEGRLKIAQALEYLRGRHSKLVGKNWWQVKFPISQQFIADIVGLTRETVSVILKDFDSKQIISYPKQMTLQINKKQLDNLLGS